MSYADSDSYCFCMYLSPPMFILRSYGRDSQEEAPSSESSWTPRPNTTQMCRSSSSSLDRIHQVSRLLLFRTKKFGLKKPIVTVAKAKTNLGLTTLTSKRVQGGAERPISRWFVPTQQQQVGRAHQYMRWTSPRDICRPSESGQLHIQYVSEKSLTLCLSGNSYLRYWWGSLRFSEPMALTGNLK